MLLWNEAFGLVLVQISPMNLSRRNRHYQPVGEVFSGENTRT